MYDKFTFALSISVAVCCIVAGWRCRSHIDCGWSSRRQYVTVIIIMQRLTHRVSVIRTTNHKRRLFYVTSLRADSKANSHCHARHNKTVLSVLRPLRWCELDSRQLRTVTDRKLEVRTRWEQWSTGTPDTTETGPSSVAVWIGQKYDDMADLLLGINIWSTVRLMCDEWQLMSNTSVQFF